MRSKTIQPILIILFFMFLYTSVEGSEWELIQPSKYTDSNLTQVIEEGWDKNLFNINELFPSGTLERGNIKKRFTANYYVGLNLKDVNRKASVRFYQNEESLQNNEPIVPALRKVFIICDSGNELEKTYNQIKTFIQKEYPNSWPIMQTSDPTKFRIMNFTRFHDNGEIILELEKGKTSVENELVINIQYTRVKVLSPEEVKKLLEKKKHITNH